MLPVLGGGGEFISTPEGKTKMLPVWGEGIIRTPRKRPINMGGGGGGSLVLLTKRPRQA